MSADPSLPPPASRDTEHRLTRDKDVWGPVSADGSKLVRSSQARADGDREGGPV